MTNNPTSMEGLTLDASPLQANTPSPELWEQVAAELNSLRSNVHWLRDTVDTLMARVDAQASLIESQAAANESLTRSRAEQDSVIDQLSRAKFMSSDREIKGHDPPVFKGSPKELDAWVLALRLQFSLQPSKFPSESTKTQYAVTFMEGPPKAWVAPLTSKFLTELGGVPEFDSFDTFVSSIRSLYGDPNLANNALNSLKTIRQTSSVPEYYSRFVGFSQHTRLCDTALRAYFYDGLQEALKDELATRDCPTLESLKTMATYLDSRMQERKWEKEHLTDRTGNKRPDSAPQNNYGTRPAFPRAYPLTQAPPVPPRPKPAPTAHPVPYRPPPPRPAVPSAAPPSGSTPMELDYQQLKPLTEAERQKCIQEGRCFRCRQVGHSLTFCPRARVPTRFGVSELEVALSENGQGQE